MFVCVLVYAFDVGIALDSNLSPLSLSSLSVKANGKAPKWRGQRFWEVGAH